MRQRERKRWGEIRGGGELRHRKGGGDKMGGGGS